MEHFRSPAMISGSVAIEDKGVRKLVEIRRIPEARSRIIVRGTARSGLFQSAFVASIVLALSACSTLPVSGPTGHEIERAAREASSGVSGQLPFELVEV